MGGLMVLVGRVMVLVGGRDGASGRGVMVQWDG